MLIQKEQLKIYYGILHSLKWWSTYRLYFVNLPDQGIMIYIYLIYKCAKFYHYRMMNNPSLMSNTAQMSSIYIYNNPHSDMGDFFQ